MTCFLNIDISHQSNESFFTPLSYLFWRLSFRSYTNFFFKKLLNFCVFLPVPHLVDNYAKIVDERGRSLMCNRTLPSLLVIKNIYLICLRTMFLTSSIIDSSWSAGTEWMIPGRSITVRFLASLFSIRIRGMTS